ISITKRAVVTMVCISLPVACVAATIQARFAPRVEEVQRLFAPDGVPPSEPSLVTVSETLPKKTPTRRLLPQVVARAPLLLEQERPEVRLRVSVTDRVGRYVTGLSAKDFRLMAGDISSFGDTEAEHSVVLLNTLGGDDESVDALRKGLMSRDQVE